ncbi:IS701 family transposase [Streptomyces bacillaris]|uniref:IS701 family transposase n=1 Tax=Streptomyces bacillaris TaxID=68179 RepID=UPI000F7B8303|nr:transposase [Streptomyces sp. WAC04770]RST23421.1 transposase [Streptomyces sp. WAC04770]
MTRTIPQFDHAVRATGGRPGAAMAAFRPYERAHDGLLSALGTELFASMPRRDQRTKGMAYLQGLLEAEGRKSIRNIAALFGGDATEQSLHHFIVSSTWDWTPVRRALAQYVERVTQPQAYVVRPLIIRRAGETSVGVERRFVPALGQVVNAQQAVGVWAAAPDWSSPLNWRLQLSPRWLADRRHRRQTDIPDSEVPESLDQCSVKAYQELIKKSRLPIRPVVMDAQETDVAAVVGWLRAADTPMLLRIDGTQRLTVEEPAFPRRGVSMTAQQIMSLVWHMRRPGRRPGEGPTAPGPVVAVRVTLSHAARREGRSDSSLVLMGVAEHGHWPAELWLTDLTTSSVGELLQLASYARRVERDTKEVADRVGIRDFSGRSFAGWHRHTTLASAAHAIAMLSDRAEPRLLTGTG